jgi:hypothetical protein
MSFPRPFCLVRPARTAIALELLWRAQAQVDRCGACAVADGEWCAALTVVASRVFQWPQRAGRRPERLPVLRPLTAPALPIA